jgi:hypothetical protein
MRRPCLSSPIVSTGYVAISLMIFIAHVDNIMEILALRDWQYDKHKKYLLSMSNKAWLEPECFTLSDPLQLLHNAESLG